MIVAVNEEIKQCGRFILNKAISNVNEKEQIFSNKMNDLIDPELNIDINNGPSPISNKNQNVNSEQRNSRVSNSSSDQNKNISNFVFLKGLFTLKLKLFYF